MAVSIRFVAIIGKDNSPLYLRSFDKGVDIEEESSLSSETNLRYHFLAHMALDYIISQLGKSESSKDYALLLVHDGVAVYGCLTNTSIKILIGIDASDNTRFDLRTILRSIQWSYISYVCNPFHDIEDSGEITSRAFDRSIVKISTSINSAATGFM